MPNIFNYTDYRKFLQDFYQHKKRSSVSFSYQNFSRQAGFKSKSFVFNVIQGKKNLSKASVVALSEAMKLTKTEAMYFEKLVSMCQATTFKERAFFYEQLDSIRPQNTEASTAKRLRQDQFEYYSKWYYSVIRSLIDLHPFTDNYKQLSAMVHPPITPLQAKKAVQLLERLGLITRGSNDVFHITDKILTTGPEVSHIAAQQFHLETMELAARALREMPGNKRNISGMTLGISQKTFSEIQNIMIECQERILQVAENDAHPENVFQLNIQIFPVSNAPAKRGTE